MAASITVSRDRLQSYVREKTRDAVTRIKDKESVNRVRHGGEAMLAAGVMGFIRGKMENAAGEMPIPGTQIDAEAIVGLAMVGTAYLDETMNGGKLLGQLGQDLFFGGVGVLSHYSGQIARKFAKTGKLDLVAGGTGRQIIGAEGLRAVTSFGNTAG